MTVYYVRKSDGNDKDNGLSPGKAFSSLFKGESVLKPGDKLIVQGGTYGPIKIDVHKVEVEGQNGARIDATGQEYGALITSSQVKFHGFEVKGGNTGIHIRHAYGVDVYDNYVHHAKTNGIYAFRSNFISIHHNESAFNGGEKGAAGISVHLPDQSLGKLKWTYGIRVHDNLLHHNKMTKPGTEGWGAIYDEPIPWRERHADFADYNLKALFKGNVAYENGKYGILIFHAKNTVVSNNILAHNSTDASTAEAELGIKNSSNIDVLNNIGIADGDKDPDFVFRTNDSDDILFRGNRSWVEGQPDNDGINWLRSTKIDAPSSANKWADHTLDHFDYVKVGHEVGVDAAPIHWNNL